MQHQMTASEFLNLAHWLLGNDKRVRFSNLDPSRASGYLDPSSTVDDRRLTKEGWHAFLTFAAGLSLPDVLSALPVPHNAYYLDGQGNPVWIADIE